MTKKSPTLEQTMKFPVLNEEEFYQVYLTLNNIYLQEDKKLNRQAIKFLAAILAKPLDFILDFHFRHSNVNKKAGRISPSQQLSEELGITRVYAYQILKRLRDTGNLVLTEDKILVFSDNLKLLREQMKTYVDKFDVVNFDFAFKLKVVDDEQENDTNIPTSIY